MYFLQDNKFLDDLEKQREKAKRRESGSSDRSPTTSSASSAMIQRAGDGDSDPWLKFTNSGANTKRYTCECILKYTSVLITRSKARRNNKRNGQCNKSGFILINLI